MGQVYQNIGQIVLMLSLLCCSAFFSGAETAFFNLSRRQLTLFKKSEHKFERLVATLLSKPRELLGCLLLGNMTVNVLYYAASSVVVLRVEEQSGAGAAFVTAISSLVLLIIFGEIFPKSVAYGNSRSIGLISSFPAFLFLRVLRPVLFLFNFLVVEPAFRLLLGPSRRSRNITMEEFKSLIEQVRKHGLISQAETRLFSEIIELGFLKVRDCLCPRVDMVACLVTDSRERAIALMRANNLTKLPVYVGEIDNIVGMVYLRQLLLRHEVSLDKLVQPVNFVPEQKTVESLLEFFRRSHTDTAIVVDEYGGISGSIRLEDIAEELLGPIEISDTGEPIEQMGPFEYRLSGDLSIHDWSRAFGIEPAEAQISTIGGLVTALLGKIPKSGDEVRLKNLKFTVERVRKRRIETVLLKLEPIVADD